MIEIDGFFRCEWCDAEVQVGGACTENCPGSWGLCYGEPVHQWFGLTYANYLVLQRSLLQSMPEEWQRRFVVCLHELAVAFDHLDHPHSLTVSARDSTGRFVRDPIPHYNRGRTRIEPQGHR